MGNGRVFFRVIVGGYLAYLGFGLVRDAITEKPANYIIFLLVGAAFTAIGLFWAVRSIQLHLKEQKEEQAAAQDEDEQEADNNDNEKEE